MSELLLGILHFGQNRLRHRQEQTLKVDEERDIVLWQHKWWQTDLHSTFLISCFLHPRLRLVVDRHNA